MFKYRKYIFPSVGIRAHHKHIALSRCKLQITSLDQVYLTILGVAQGKIKLLVYLALNNYFNIHSLYRLTELGPSISSKTKIKLVKKLIFSVRPLLQDSTPDLDIIVSQQDGYTLGFVGRSREVTGLEFGLLCKNRKLQPAVWETFISVSSQFQGANSSNLS